MLTEQPGTRISRGLRNSGRYGNPMFRRFLLQTGFFSRSRNFIWLWGGDRSRAVSILRRTCLWTCPPNPENLLLTLSWALGMVVCSHVSPAFLALQSYSRISNWFFARLAVGTAEIGWVTFAQLYLDFQLRLDTRDLYGCDSNGWTWTSGPTSLLSPTLSNNAPNVSTVSEASVEGGRGPGRYGPMPPCIAHNPGFFAGGFTALGCLCARRG